MKTDPRNFVGYKVILYPTNDHKKVFNEYFGLSRFIYNLAIDIEEEYYNVPIP